jgi:cell division septation protein DedD
VLAVGLILGFFAFMTWRFGPLGEGLRGSARRLEPPPLPSAPPAEPGDREPGGPDTSEPGGPAAAVTPHDPAALPVVRAPMTPAPGTPAPASRPRVTQAPESSRPAPPPDTPAPRDEPAGVARPGSSAPKPQPGATASIPAARFAVEFGPFVTAPEADALERQLNEAGYQTVRFRQRISANVFAVLIERLPDRREAQRVAAALREQGFPDPVILDRKPGAAVRVGEPTILRGAVELGEQLRARGYDVKVATQPGEAVTFVVRHGNFTARDDAETKSQELQRLGLANHVVRVR